jgi:putative acetyltransferase
MIVIKPIEENQIEQAKQIVITVSLEIWQGELSAVDLQRIDLMSDISNVKSHYFDNRGLFLVLIDRKKVVGTGAIRQLSDQICELKRMWFLQPYRGQGLGKKMTQILFDFARNEGYQKVRLDLANETKQLQAMRFYRKLGFYTIERYNDSPCTVFMEKVL